MPISEDTHLPSDPASKPEQIHNQTQHNSNKINSCSFKRLLTLIFVQILAFHSQERTPLLLLCGTCVLAGRDSDRLRV